jgi:hypothetical protein
MTLCFTSHHAINTDVALENTYSFLLKLNTRQNRLQWSKIHKTQAVLDDKQKLSYCYAFTFRSSCKDGTIKLCVIPKRQLVIQRTTSSLALSLGNRKQIQRIRDPSQVDLSIALPPSRQPAQQPNNWHSGTERSVLCYIKFY